MKNKRELRSTPLHHDHSWQRIGCGFDTSARRIHFSLRECLIIFSMASAAPFSSVCTAVIPSSSSTPCSKKERVQHRGDCRLHFRARPSRYRHEFSCLYRGDATPIQYCRQSKPMRKTWSSCTRWWSPREGGGDGII